MNLNLILHYIASTTLNLEESTITSQGDTFTILGKNGQVFTESDITKEQIHAAQTQLQLKLVQQRENGITAKAQAEAKLQALGLTADDLRALGL